jgi:hypothetical protein
MNQPSNASAIKFPWIVDFQTLKALMWSESKVEEASMNFGRLPNALEYS